MRLKVFHFFAALRAKVRIAKFRFRGIRVGQGVRLGHGIEIASGFAPDRACRVTIGDGCHLSRGVVVHTYDGAVTLARDIFVGPYTVIYGHGGVSIGRDTLISMHCRILSSNHTVPDGEDAIRSRPDILLPTTIGRDCWLGAGVTVLGGVTIGDRCVVGAGAVVTRDLPPNSVAVGVPAAVIRRRS